MTISKQITLTSSTLAHLVSERDQHQQNTAKINKLKLFCTVRELKKHVSDDHEKSEEEIEAKMVNMIYMIYVTETRMLDSPKPQLRFDSRRWASGHR